MPHSVSSIPQNFCTGNLPSTYLICYLIDSRALKPPGYHKEWHVGVRVASNKKLVAFISGVPATLRVRSK